MKSPCRRIVIACAAFTVAIFSYSAASAADWIGANAAFDKTVPPETIGWAGSMPNGQGAVGQKTDATGGTATLSFGGVTLGTIRHASSSNVAFGILPTGGLTLDQDGAGTGFALIENVNPSSGASNGLVIGQNTSAPASSVTLADDLLIRNNATNSTRPSGAIIFSSSIGGVGNVTFENNSNPFPTSTDTTVGTVGTIRFRSTAANTYVGNVLVRKGTIVFDSSNANPFGASGNAVTLGESGQGGVTITSIAAATVPNNITIAAGTGGATILGGINTTLTTYSGSILLNGDLTTTSRATSAATAVTYSGVISGVGGITHFSNTSTGAPGTGWATLSGANTYTGKTTISSGTLRVSSINRVVGGTASSNLGAPTTVATGTIDFGGADNVATLLYEGTGETTDRVINLVGTSLLGETGGGTITSSGTGPLEFTSNLAVTGTGNKTFTLGGTNTGLNTFSGIIADSSPSSVVGLTKSAAGSWLLTNANTYSGNTTVASAGGTLYIRNGQAIPDGVGKGDVTLTGGSLVFDSNHSETINGLGSAGAVTTSANVTNPVTLTLGGNIPGASYTHSGTISNGGAGALSVVKQGLSTQIFSGTKSYTGTTTINEGVLQFSTTTAIAGAGENVTVNFGGTAATSITGGINQAFLDRIVDSSTGVVALGNASANNLDFGAANLANVSLGATGTFIYSGIVFPHGSTYRLGGGGPAGQLSVSSSLSGAGRSLIAGGSGSTTANKVVLTGTNSYDGTTTVVGGTLQVANQVSLYGGVPGSWTDTNIIVESGATLAFSVGGIGQFTMPQFLAFTDLGTVSGGFKNGSIIGLDSTGLGTDVTIPDVIDNPNGGSNSLGFTKLGTNNVVLSGANTFTGKTTIEAGTLSVASINRVVGGTASSSLGAPTTVVDGTIHLGFGTSAGTLIYTGAGETTDRGLNFAGTSGTGIFVANGTGPISFDGAITATGFGNKTVTVRGTNTGDNTITGAINNLNNSTTVGASLIKSEAGTWVLAGDNTYSGDTTVQGGILKITGSHNAIPLNISPMYSVATANGQTATVVFQGGSGDSISGLSEIAVGGGTGTTGTGGNGTFIQMGGTVSINSSLATTKELSIGQGTTTSTVNPVGLYDLQGGTLNVEGHAYIGRDRGMGTLNNAGTINTTGEFRVGYDSSSAAPAAGSNSQGIFNNLAGGTLNTPSLRAGTGVVNANTGDPTPPSSLGAETTGTINQLSNAAINVTGDMMVGDTGSGTFNQSAGTVTVGGHYFFGNLAGFVGTPTAGTTVVSTGTLNMSGGTATVAGDVSFGYLGNGTLNMTGGSISSAGPFGFAIARGAGVTGTGTMSGGTISTVGLAADFRVGMAGNGTLTHTGGTIESENWVYVGVNSPGNGTYNISGSAVCNPGDNIAIGYNSGTTGVINMTGGTITVAGNQPFFTGNFIVGRSGTGTLNISNGTIDLVVPATPTVTYPLGSNNSASYSIANNTGGFGHELDLAQDGNFIVSQLAGPGTVTQTGGLIKVAANVYVGGSTGGAGSITMSGGQILVGLTSPTGGDVVLGGVAGTGTINLQGSALLDVTRGSGKIGGGVLSTANFYFTGGTLKVKEYNVNDFQGSLNPLSQSGANSVLDVTGNNTILNGGYTLAAGTVKVARQLTVNSGDANLSSGGEYQWQLGALSTTNAGVDFGQIVLTNDLVLGGTSKLELDFSLLGVNGPNGSNVFWDANHTWKIIDTMTNNSSMDFSSLLNPNFASGTFATSIGTDGDLGDIFLTFTPSTGGIPGDFDDDGDVDGADFIMWQTNFPATMDGGDFADWQSTFPFTPGPGNSPVPEPASWSIAILALGGLALRLRRSS